MTTPTDREALVKLLTEEIGSYGVQCSETKELSPSKSLTDALASITAVLHQADYWEGEAKRYAANADFWRERSEAALTAQGGEQTICGACGTPWKEGMICGQKDNGHPFLTCYPAQAQGGEQTADTERVPDAFGCDNEARKGKSCLRWCGRAECPASGPIAEACKKAVDSYIYDFAPDLDYRGEFSERLYAYKIGFLDGFAAAREGKS